MTDRRILAARLARVLIAAALAAAAPSVAALAAGSPIPRLTPSPSPRPHGDPPMRIQRVMSSDPACGDDCPEWISAEGMIRPGSAAALAKIVSGLNGRRLPVLISSHGGAVRDALEMAALIRARGLAVAVARTLLVNCSERGGDCPAPRGQAIVGGAVCASACPLVLAGGVERLVGPAPRIGVHQITTVVKESEGVVGLTKTVKIYEHEEVDKTVADALAALGIGEPVMTLLRKTPAASIYWLSLDEIKASGLATGALDPARPVLSEGAGGLNGAAFASAGAPDALMAKLADADGSGASLTLAYRRGGGALELSLAGAADRPATAWAATVGAAPLVFKADGGGPARALLPRTAFCALGRDGRIVASFAPTAAAKSLTFDLGGATGVRALLDEACP